MILELVGNRYRLNLSLQNYGHDWVTLYEHISHMYLLNIKGGSLELAACISSRQFDLVENGKLIINEECDNIWEGS